ncbi:ABC transporter permease [Shinella pollutisoli]|uniref:ABC transporter permease n=1 Tax=Shinella pollutisoli TaxID=2250594 RepID=A0ABV7DGW1_9HYPH|nr:ABC transporter permease [Shinella pollutisoli]
MSAIAENKRASVKKKGVRFGVLLNLTLFFLLLAIWAILAFTTESFLTENNITNLMRQFSLLAIIAIGQTFVIITAGIDLSVGAVVGLTSVIVAMLLAAGVPIWLAVSLTLLAGVLIGAVHAFGVSYMKLPPFIVTLAGLTGWRGLGLLMTNGLGISGLPPEFNAFSRGFVLGLPTLFWMVVVVAVPAYVLLHKARIGKYIFAVGSNAEAARLSGIDARQTIFVVYIISSTCAALAGILVTSRLGLGIATTGDGWELQAIASSVIGGTSLFGAIGSIIGPTLGSLLLSTINQGANLLNVNPFWQRIITALLIVVVVFVDHLRRRRS